MRQRPRVTTALLLLGWGALASDPAQATTVLAVPLAQMAADSDVIVHARVGAQRVEWDKDRARILTLTSIEVIEGLKGAAKGDTLTIYQVGGTLDGVTFKIPGALSFAPGDEMVFFAARFEDKLVSYGMGLGKYAVHGAAGDKIVLPELGDVTFVQRAGDGSYQPAAGPAQLAQPLPRFLEQVRAELAHPTWQRPARLHTLPTPAGGEKRAGPAPAREGAPDARSKQGGAR